MSGDAMGAVLGALSREPDNAGLVTVLGGCWTVLLVGIGFWLVIAPRRAWRLRHSLSLMYKHPERVEPSTFAIVYYRVSGVVAILVGVGIAVLFVAVIARA